VRTITFRELIKLPHNERPIVRAKSGWCEGDIVTLLRADWSFHAKTQGGIINLCRGTPDTEFEIVELR
jgi:hypothetical protein